MIAAPTLALLLCASSRAQGPVKSYADRVKDIVRTPSVVSPLGPVDTPLPLDLANFLLDHPDIAAFVIHRRRIAPYRVVMTGPGEARADDGEGTKGLIALVERDDRARTYFGDGMTQRLHLPPIHATAAVFMKID